MQSLEDSSPKPFCKIPWLKLHKFFFLSRLRYKHFSGNNLVKPFEKSLNSLQGV